MFDLMGAIRHRQKAQKPAPAKTADFSARDIFSATIRKDPQNSKTSEPHKTRELQGLSAKSADPGGYEQEEP
jgi:hypothetical protein